MRAVTPQTWSILAFQDTPLEVPFIEEAQAGFRSALRGCRIVQTDGLVGYTYSDPEGPSIGSTDKQDLGDGRMAIWPAGTSQVALALLKTGEQLIDKRPDTARSKTRGLDLLRVSPSSQNVDRAATLESHKSVLLALRQLKLTARTGAKECKGMPGAYPELVTKTFGEGTLIDTYYNVPNIGATAWWIMAEFQWNPFWGTPIGREKGAW